MTTTGDFMGPVIGAPTRTMEVSEFCETTGTKDFLVTRSGKTVEMVSFRRDGKRIRYLPLPGRPTEQ